MHTPFFQGTLVCACAIAGLFFLRFWRVSRDRLFVYFAAGFWLLGLHWLALGLSAPEDEMRHYYYVVRLAAFGLIVLGILDKNRRSARRS